MFQTVPQTGSPRFFSDIYGLILRLSSPASCKTTLSEAEKLRKTVLELTTKNINNFINVLKNLRVKIPKYFLRSSNAVKEAVTLIEILLEKKVAYWYTYDDRKNIYFDPTQFKNFGKLFGINMDKWPKKKIRFHKDTYPGSRWNRGDFIIWHGFKEGDSVFWETKIGKGRPSWNIQDPAMIPPHFDSNVDIGFSDSNNPNLFL